LTKIKFLFKYILFWLLLFNITRAIFLIYYYKQVIDETLINLIIMPVHAFMLDLSMISYILVIPLLLYVSQCLIDKYFFFKFIRIYTIIIAGVYLIIAAAEINLYAEWQTKIDYRAIVYLKNPSEVFKTATWLQTIIFFIYLIGVLWFLIKVYNKTLFQNQHPIYGTSFRSKVYSVILLLTGLPLLLLGIRGGFQTFPINQSWSYYSKNNTVNLASVNALWNVLGSAYQNASTLNKNPYLCMSSKEANERVKQLMSAEKDTTIYFLSNQKPNIVLLILESFSADLVQSCGGDTGITPQFEKLIKDGYLFDQIYSSGTLSHQGMAAIFSGFPAQPVTSIIKEQAKFSKLPCINSQLLKHGYNTSFYFGGQLTFANIKSYMYFNKFDKIKDIDDYDDALPRGKLGLHDQYTFADHLNELNAKPQPFFSAVFTQSTHSPYDIPIKWVIKKGGSEQDFLNGAWYSDSCIGSYINECKKQDWYKNTLFIAIADHSKHTHYDRNYFEPLNRHIPMLFFGEVIKPEFKGKVNHILASQHDLAATLLHQLNMDAKSFKWSRNLMNPYTKDYAYYALTSGFGWAIKEGGLAYNYQTKQLDWINIDNKLKEEQSIKDGKAYLQVLFQQYLDY
jgi:phosphoglycerol transferase MdoB-like AlkP superfamily enzyme